MYRQQMEHRLGGTEMRYSLEVAHRVLDCQALLHIEVASGWEASLVERVYSGDSDAAIVLFPATKVLPEGGGAC